MIWKSPHISKVYEALTAIADKRIEIEENIARCYSSSRGKFYEVKYDPKSDSIMSDDNTAYYTDSVSYPMIALLMLKGKLAYEERLLPMLEGIYWKDINQKFRNNYDEAIECVLTGLKEKGVDTQFVRMEIAKIYEEICNMKLNYLGQKRRPPEAY